MKQVGRSLLIAIVVSGVLPAARADEDAIPFSTDLTMALATARDSDRLVVVYFASPRCVWCRRFESLTLTSDRIRSMGDQFFWVQPGQADLDVLMGRFGVMGWPTVVVLNGRGEEVGRQSGYVDVEAFRLFLLRQLEGSDAPSSVSDLVARLREGANSGERVSQELKEVVEALARSDRANRETLLEAVAESGSSQWQGLCELMDSERLAIRAAAGHALAYVSGQDIPFDPFADKAVRDDQIAAWLAWLADRPAEPSAVPADEAERPGPEELAPVADTPESPASPESGL